jgi:peptide/nickel transport system substrate-binding protein
MISTFVTNGYVIGVVGEDTVPTIVSSNFHNLREGLVMDDVSRGIGLGVTQQMWMSE